MNCTETGKTGTQNPLLPFLGSFPICPPLFTTKPFFRLVEMDPQFLNCTHPPRPSGFGVWDLGLPLPLLDLAKFPEASPLPPPSPPLPIGGHQGGYTGERGFPGRGRVFGWPVRPRGKAKNRLPWEKAGNMSHGVRDLGLGGWDGGNRGNGLLGTFSPPLRHKALHPLFFWHCCSCTAVLRHTT